MRLLHCLINYFLKSDMVDHWEFDQTWNLSKKFTPPDFQAKKFTPSISPNFNSFSGKKHKKMGENVEIYTAGKNFTLLPAVTALTTPLVFFLPKKT